MRRIDSRGWCSVLVKCHPMGSRLIGLVPLVLGTGVGIFGAMVVEEYRRQRGRSRDLANAEFATRVLGAIDASGGLERLRTEDAEALRAAWRGAAGELALEPKMPTANLLDELGGSQNQH